MHPCKIETQLQHVDVTKNIEMIDFINNEDRTFLSSISHILSDCHFDRSEQVIEAFIVSDKEHPTDYAKYLKIKLEIWNILLDIKSTSFNYLEKTYNIELIRYQKHELETKLIKTVEDNIIIKIKDVNLLKELLELDILKRHINDKIKELKSFNSLYTKIEYIDKLSETEIHELEKDMWNKKISNNQTEFIQKYGEKSVNYFKQVNHDNSNK